MSEMNVKSVEYDKETETLTVYYNGGSVHSYTPVSDAEFNACQSAENISKAVHYLTRKGNLVGKKVEIND